MNTDTEIWVSSLSLMPRLIRLSLAPLYVTSRDLYDTEKAAINAARKLRIAEINRLDGELDKLDERLEAIEASEVAAAEGTVPACQTKGDSQ
jgi:hypothetical protein